MFTFYSRLTVPKTIGKGPNQKTIQEPVLRTVMMGTKPGVHGWFGAQINAKRETALKLASKVAARVPDLVVEDENGPVAIPGMILV